MHPFSFKKQLFFAALMMATFLSAGAAPQKEMSRAARDQKLNAEIGARSQAIREKLAAHLSHVTQKQVGALKREKGEGAAMALPNVLILTLNGDETISITPQPVVAESHDVKALHNTLAEEKVTKAHSLVEGALRELELIHRSLYGAKRRPNYEGPLTCTIQNVKGAATTICEGPVFETLYL